MSENLETKRQTISSRLENLKASEDVTRIVAEADAAVREFKKEAETLEGQVAAIDREIGALERVRRDAEARERLSRRAEIRKKLAKERDTLLDEAGEAETATRNLVDSLNAALAANERARSLAQQLREGRQLPSILSNNDLVSRVSGRIASVLATIRGHKFRFGSLEWPSGAAALHPASASWRDSEAKALAALLPLITAKD